MPTAFDLSYPYDGVDAFEQEWRDMFRALGSGVVAGADNELAVFGDSSGRQVKVPTGRIWAAGEFGKVTAQKTLAIAANSSGQPRIDRVIARNLFGTQIELDVLTGTPGASPVPPALTSDGTMQEFSLAQVGPLASGFTTVAAGQVTDEAAYISNYGPPAFGTGAAFSLWVPVPGPGMMFFLRDSGGLYLYDGSGFIQQRREEADLNYQAGGNQDITSGSFSIWPTGLHLSVDVPAWATRAHLKAKIGEPLSVTATLDHQVNLDLGALNGDSQVFVWPVGFQQDIVLEADVDCTSLAGTPQILQTVANRAGGSGSLRVDANSNSYIGVEFR